MVLVGESVCFGQASRGVDGTGEDVQHRRGTSLAGQVSVDERGHRGRPRHLDASPTCQDDDGAGIGRNDGLNESVLALGQAHVGTIQALGFSEFVESDVDERDVSARGEVHGLGNESVARATVALVSGRVSSEDESSGGLAPGGKELVRSLNARGIHLGGTRALEARRSGEVTDEGDAGPGAQGQELVLVA